MIISTSWFYFITIRTELFRLFVPFLSPFLFRSTFSSQEKHGFHPSSVFAFVFLITIFLLKLFYSRLELPVSLESDLMSPIAWSSPLQPFSSHLAAVVVLFVFWIRSFSYHALQSHHDKTHVIFFEASQNCSVVVTIAWVFCTTFFPQLSRLIHIVATTPPKSLLP